MHLGFGWWQLVLASGAVATWEWSSQALNNSGRAADPLEPTLKLTSPPLYRRQAQSRFLNENSQKFVVNGTAIPEVGFDVGESYAGLLPINGTNDPNQLYFWFFPSADPEPHDEILIWLTGGPGCSSVGELLQENGPFLWPPGVFKPVRNKWSWHRLTNVVWIDQPVGAGFSQGVVTARNEFDVARQFMGFWKNFVDVFGLQNFKVYVTGSSYSGLYCPYIAHEMIDAEDPEYFDVGGMMIFDALYSKDAVSQDIPMVPFVDSWQRAFSFNQTFTELLHTRADECGYTQYLEEFLVFPPAGEQPSDLPGYNEDGFQKPECNMISQVFSAAIELNPCFTVYSVFDHCPRPHDPLGFSGGSFVVHPDAGPVYFDRPDVKAAINAPADTEWVFCSSQAGRAVFVDGVDESLNGGPAAQPVLPRIIETTGNVILGHGARDFVLTAAGTLLAIQNITWGGVRGFQTEPRNPLFAPYHSDEAFDVLAGAGIFGSWHEERGLTYFGVEGAGHFLTIDQPAVAFRAVEILLGRVEDFQSTVAFTTDANATQQPTLDLNAAFSRASALGSTAGGRESSGASLGEGWPTMAGIVLAWLVLTLLV
ncbi:hypothetical protein jhhlp_000823 [Lomentospora prolificans]|uniref:Serine carboxypeptidase n=1 Tax=Lomentospora prolificans TaxID=41688 RepID=A0A2N3NJJ0_9PEZI|nr:hypothetical protein jhhlp_000823 [Lomentospora prolificans]